MECEPPSFVDYIMIMYSVDCKTALLFPFSLTLFRSVVVLLYDQWEYSRGKFCHVSDNCKSLRASEQHFASLLIVKQSV